MAKDLRNDVVIQTASSSEVEKFSAKEINLFSLASNFQQTIYYTALPCFCAFEIFITEILVTIPVPPVNLFINGFTLWPWQATDSRNSSGHQFLRETPWWLICHQTSDSIVCPWFIVHYPSIMLNIVLFMQIIEGHILTRLGLLTFNEYIKYFLYCLTSASGHSQVNLFFRLCLQCWAFQPAADTVYRP